MVSFNKGATWERIQSQTPGCVFPQCALNLHLGFTDILGFRAPLSTASAPGTLIALGNEGFVLTNRPNLCAFVSSGRETSCCFRWPLNRFPSRL
jgi:hypothetical protein